MAPIIDFFDFVLSNYFNEFSQYKQIKQLKLPAWFQLLVALFVLLILYWIVLVAIGLKHGIHRYVIAASRNRNPNGQNADTTFQRSRSNADDDDDDVYEDSSNLWVHINARKPTH